MAYPLPTAEPAALGLDANKLNQLCARIESDIAKGLHPGAEVAVARHGKLALARSFGEARVGSHRMAAEDRTLFLLYSNTKVITAAAIWLLAEEGALRYGDRVADHVAGFEKHHKGEITIIQLLTHQGGFPSSAVTPEAWSDHDLLRRQVCDFQLEWVPGSRVHYHPSAAHWTASVLIEALTGKDFRTFVHDRIVTPLGLSDEIMVGVPEASQTRCAEMYDPDSKGSMVPRQPECSPAHRAAGVPGGGGYATARGMAAFYQALGNGGRLGDVRLLSPRTIEYVTRNFTGDRADMNNGFPPHRGLGPSTRGLSETSRGLGTLAHPRTFGHGGAGSSYCWADPVSGVSFAFLSNARLTNEAHDLRTEVLSNFVHAAIVE